MSPESGKSESLPTWQASSARWNDARGFNLRSEMRRMFLGHPDKQ